MGRCIWKRRQKCERKEKRTEVGIRELKGLRVVSCISFLDSCLLDDRIKESFNMTSVHRVLILTHHTLSLG